MRLDCIDVQYLIRNLFKGFKYPLSLSIFHCRGIMRSGKIYSSGVLCSWLTGTYSSRTKHSPFRRSSLHPCLLDRFCPIQKVHSFRVLHPRKYSGYGSDVIRLIIFLTRFHIRSESCEQNAIGSRSEYAIIKNRENEVLMVRNLIFSSIADQSVCSDLWKYKSAFFVSISRLTACGENERLRKLQELRSSLLHFESIIDFLYQISHWKNSLWCWK